MKTLKAVKSISLLVALSSLVFTMYIGCASIDRHYHSYIMRGQILNVTGSEAYLCIGSKDGAEVGQEYIVYKNVVKTFGDDVTPLYEKVKIGTVRISRIVDQHYATGIILSGKAEKNSVVELERPLK